MESHDSKCFWQASDGWCESEGKHGCYELVWHDSGPSREELVVKILCISSTAQVVGSSLL